MARPLNGKTCVYAPMPLRRHSALGSDESALGYLSPASKTSRLVHGLRVARRVRVRE